MDADLDRDLATTTGQAPPDARGAGQLRLLDPAPRPSWRLDDHTRAVGRQGVAAARAALASARRRHPEDESGHPTAA